MAEPCVSIALPLYRSKFDDVRDLLDRLAKTCSVAEIVVSDDDPEHSRRTGVAELLGASSLPVTYVSNRSTLGMTGNWNAAVRACRSEYVLLHCQDDLVVPAALDGLVESMIERSVPVAAGAYANFADSGPMPTPTRFGDRSPTLHIERFETVVQQALTFGNVYGFPSSTVFARRLWDSVEGYRGRYEHAADLDFLLRATERAGVLLVQPDPVAERRVHDANLTHQHVASGATGRDRERMWADFNHYLGESKLRRRARSMMTLHAAFDAARHLRAGRFRPARASFGRVSVHTVHGGTSLGWAVRTVLGDRRDERSGPAT